MQVRLPNNSNRLTVVGPTGSGKTQAALWHLSQRNLNSFPWVVFDFKFDEHINNIESAHHVDVGFTPNKKHTGIFVVHPVPDKDDEAVEEMMWKLWQRENVGIWIDESYMIADNNKAIKAILTQGRSKHVPVIALTQRPVDVSRFFFSEASFIQVFSVTDKRDAKTINNFAPIPFYTPLPAYHSFYFDVDRRKLHLFSPVPQESNILETIESKLQKVRKFI